MGVDNITFIDLGGKIDSLAVSPKYQQSAITSACADDPTYRWASPNKNNCNYRHSSKWFYFNWNNAHLSVEVNQDIADFLQNI